MINLIKGHGGALLHEKIVASASRELAIIVDEAKLADGLGRQPPMSVAVVASGLEITQKFCRKTAGL